MGPLLPSFLIPKQLVWAPRCTVAWLTKLGAAAAVQRHVAVRSALNVYVAEFTMSPTVFEIKQTLSQKKYHVRILRIAVQYSCTLLDTSIPVHF